MPDDKPLHRRQFFRRGLSEFLKPLVKAIEPIERASNHLEKLQSIPQSKPQAAPKTVPLQVWLRPPGALNELQFLATCQRCGECVKVCPAQAIKLDPDNKIAGGAPYIDADTTACVVCDGLHCMSSCPSDAIIETPLTLIKMGTAVWREHLCVRTNGESCAVCVEICPLGEKAIALSGNEIEVKPIVCIGCGLCQQHCPTSPKAIGVIPIAAKVL